jgi:hypothetical protein
MADDLRYEQLRPQQRQLVDLMSRIRYGRIEDLLIQAGQPVFQPRPRVFCEIKLESDASPIRSHSDSPPVNPNYELKTQVRSLLQRLLQLGNGRVPSIVIADGLPLRMTVEAT